MLSYAEPKKPFYRYIRQITPYVADDLREIKGTRDECKDKP